MLNSCGSKIMYWFVTKFWLIQDRNDRLRHYSDLYDFYYFFFAKADVFNAKLCIFIMITLFKLN